MKKHLFSLTLLSAALLFPYHANACTDFKITAKDGSLLITRSMEFGMDMKSNIRNSNRNRVFTSTTPNGKPGLSWKAKYGYLYLDALNQDLALDGMNEAGLTFEYLYLPGETQYMSIPANKDNQGIPYYMFGDWVLSNFKTIDEVKEALSNVYIFSEKIPAWGDMILDGHASIFDASGKGIVIEFINGKAVVYDNIGIMTNSPTYNWHVDNLRNYLNLTPYNPNPIISSGVTFSATGQGAGSVGLPGDTSPPSRFVKTAFLNKYSYPANDSADALNLAQHIINNVDIPKGISRTKVQDGESTDITEWVVFKDITHKIFYYRTYNDMTLRSIYMDKLNFSETSPKFKMPLVEKNYIMDNTQRFMAMPVSNN